VAGTLGAGAVARGAAAQPVAQAKSCEQFCNSTSECNFGLRCGEATGRCFAIPSSRDRCDGNGECSRRFETCNNNNQRCVNINEGCVECRRDGDCPEANSRCRDGRCVVRDECNSNDDCRRRERCRRGRCVTRD